MIEADWLACNDPEPMLNFLREKTSERKLRFFAIAAFNCRGITDQNAREIDADSVHEAQEAVTVAESYADGHLAEQSMDDARNRLFFLVLLKPEAWFAAWQSSRSTVNLQCRKGNPAVKFMRKRLSSLLRDIFGNPFRPTTINPDWLTSNVVTLAQAIYDERAFDRMPELADALVEAGCDNDDILNHCRSKEPHVRGCCVVDLLLGKE